MPSTAETVPSTAASGGVRPAARRSRRMGMVALVLVPVALAAETLLGRAVPLLPAGLSDVGAYGVVFGTELIGLTAAFVLGLVAAISGRGRGAGVAAMVLALLLNVVTLSAAQQLGQSLLAR